MSKIIEQEIKEIRDTVQKTANHSDDLVFGMVCYKYFYNAGRFDYSDYQNSFTDGANDGGIDLIATNNEEDNNNLVLIQSKNIVRIDSKDVITDIFSKMVKTVDNFKKHKTSDYSSRLRTTYKNKYDEVADNTNFNIELVLFLGCNIKEKQRLKIEQLLKDEKFEDFHISMYCREEIEQQIVITKSDTRFVKEGSIDIFHKHGMIQNQENGLLVNISSNSIKDLYDKYKNNGLFEQNFRYFIKNKKIDSQINDSLHSKRDLFWFLNNGIIIGCKDFIRDGNKVKLYDFSIINGCQTATLIGEYSGDNEGNAFPIPCKIVKPDKDSVFDQFISEIAEASNSQKPIKDRDLKSNAPEQRNLQRELRDHNPPIVLEIKRGEKKPKRKDIEKWQFIKNEELGQLILAVLLQQPGTARNGKKKIFEDKQLYKIIFKRAHDLQTLTDIMRLANYYDEYMNQANLDFEEATIAKNGKLCILAIIGLFIKHLRNPLNTKLDTHTAEWKNMICSDNLKGDIFNPERADDFHQPLYSLFQSMIRKLAEVYSARGEQETSQSSFLKSDLKYYTITLKSIKSSYLTDAYEFKQLKKKLLLVFKGS